MKKFFIFLGVLFLLIIITIIGGLAYIGLVPGLAKPVDLGAKNDPALVAAFESAHAMKNEIPGGVVPAGRQAEFSGSVKLDTNMTSDEITSVLAYWKKRSPSLPIRDVQVRFNPDGTGEISGILEIKTAVGIAKRLGYSDDEIGKGKDYIKYAFGDLPFYVKGTGSITNNLITLNPTDFKLGRASVPQSITKQAAGVVGDAIERRIKQVGGVDIQSMDFSKGVLHLVGTLPDTVK